MPRDMIDSVLGPENFCDHLGEGALERNAGSRNVGAGLKCTTQPGPLMEQSHKCGSKGHRAQVLTPSSASEIRSSLITSRLASEHTCRKSHPLPAANPPQRDTGGYRYPRADTQHEPQGRALCIGAVTIAIAIDEPLAAGSSAGFRPRHDAAPDRLRCRGPVLPLDPFSDAPAPP